MRISCHRYELVSARDPRQIRRGALLRYEFPRSFGYADCHPWPELGDLPLEGQLNALKRNSPKETNLLRRSFDCAFFDQTSRAGGMNWFRLLGHPIPANHASLPWVLGDRGFDEAELSRLSSEGFRQVKVKVGTNELENTAGIARLGIASRAAGLQVRLDFNAQTDCENLVALLSRLRSETDGLDWLDWIEDPCTFDADSWKGIREQFGVRVALDRAADPLCAQLTEAVDVIVLKPAVQDLHVALRAAEFDLSLCITSYLDHPVGQCFAAIFIYAAGARGRRLETCGLITHTVYQPNAFSERLGTDGPRLIPPTGTGIGFDDLLENLHWEELR